MGDYGIKIAKPASGTVTATSLDKYNFHSKYPLLKIKRIDTGSALANTGAERLIAQINHGLGYAPMFDVVVGFNSVNTTPTIWYPMSYYINYPGLGALSYLKIFTDSTYLYIYSYKNDGNEYVFYKSVIYFDPINP